MMHTRVLPRRSLLRVAALPTSLVITVWLATACANKTSPNKSGSARPVDDLKARVLRTLAHDRNAFTQGLVYHEGKLYESTGLVGRSSLRRVDLDTGRVEQSVPVEAPFFGEGLARVGGELVQLTWQNGKAFVWNMSGLNKLKEFDYQGEGWGLCHDGKRLVMSDGSDKLTFRDAGNFAVTGSVNVTRGGQPVRHLNELECVDKVIYANIWGSDNIARIDPGTGEVTGWIDAGGLLSRTEIMGTDVLNGIAHMPDKNTFLITGKLWPRLFEVEFIPAGSLPAERP
jgi:glutamine cyclotransferase